MYNHSFAEESPDEFPDFPDYPAPATAAAATAAPATAAPAPPAADTAAAATAAPATAAAATAAPATAAPAPPAAAATAAPATAAPAPPAAATAAPAPPAAATAAAATALGNNTIFINICDSYDFYAYLSVYLLTNFCQEKKYDLMIILPERKGIRDKIDDFTDEDFKDKDKDKYDSYNYESSIIKTTRVMKQTTLLLNQVFEDALSDKKDEKDEIKCYIMRGAVNEINYDSLNKIKDEEIIYKKAYNKIKKTNTINTYYTVENIKDILCMNREDDYNKNIEDILKGYNNIYIDFNATTNLLEILDITNKIKDIIICERNNLYNIETTKTFLKKYNDKLVYINDFENFKNKANNKKYTIDDIIDYIKDIEKKGKVNITEYLNKKNNTILNLANDWKDFIKTNRQQENMDKLILTLLNINKIKYFDLKKDSDSNHDNFVINDLSSNIKLSITNNELKKTTNGYIEINKSFYKGSDYSNLISTYMNPYL